MSKPKSFSIHKTGAYREFFENKDLSGVDRVLDHLQPYKEQLRKYDTVQLKDLIAHSSSIENRQKQPQMISTLISASVSVLAIVFAILAKSASLTWYDFVAVIFMVLILIAYPAYTKSVDSFMENIGHVTLFRELAELVLKEKEDEETDTTESANSDGVNQ